MWKFGIISQLGEGENLGYARVSFDDSDFVSDWLSLPSMATTTAKQWIAPAVNSQVVCLMDAEGEQGAIVAVLWSDTDRPPQFATSDTIGIQFADGAEFFYDSSKHKLTLNAPDTEVSVSCKKLIINGDVEANGDVAISGMADVAKDIKTKAGISAVGDIATKADIKTAVVTLNTHIHTTPTGPSGPPTPPAPPTP